MGFSIKPKAAGYKEKYVGIAKTCAKSAAILDEMLEADHAKNATFSIEIHRFEARAAEGRKELATWLDETFVTPYDRDDMHEIASLLYACVKKIDKTADVIYLYNIADLPKKVNKQVKIISQMATLTLEAMNKLDSLKSLKAYWEKMAELSAESEKAHRMLLSKLFVNEKQVVQIIKTKELIEALDQTTEAFAELGDAVESLSIK